MRIGWFLYYNMLHCPFNTVYTLIFKRCEYHCKLAKCKFYVLIHCDKKQMIRENKTLLSDLPSAKYA